MAAALDGTPVRSASGAVVCPATANSNCIILVASNSNGGPFTGISDNGAGAIGAWTKFGEDTAGSAQFPITVWWAVAASPIPGSTITITVTATGGAFNATDCWAVSGCSDLVSPFDGAAVIGHPDPLSITTTVADTFIFAAFREAGTATPTAGSGFTLLLNSGAAFALSEYKIVSSTQSSLSITQTTGSGNANGGVAGAIKGGAAAAGFFSRAYYDLGTRVSNV